MFFAPYARTVTILVRGTSLTATMSQNLVDQIAAIPNVRVMARTRVLAVHGDGHLESLTLGCDDERTTVAVRLPRATIDEACAMLQQSSLPWVAVNVSPVELRSRGFVDRAVACDSSARCSAGRFDGMAAAEGAALEIIRVLHRRYCCGVH